MEVLDLEIGNAQLVYISGRSKTVSNLSFVLLRS